MISNVKDILLEREGYAFVELEQDHFVEMKQEGPRKVLILPKKGFRFLRDMEVSIISMVYRENVWHWEGQKKWAFTLHEKDDDMISLTLPESSWAAPSLLQSIFPYIISPRLKKDLLCFVGG